MRVAVNRGPSTLNSPRARAQGASTSDIVHGGLRLTLRCSRPRATHHLTPRLTALQMRWLQLQPLLQRRAFLEGLRQVSEPILQPSSYLANQSTIRTQNRRRARERACTPRLLVSEFQKTRAGLAPFLVNNIDPLFRVRRRLPSRVHDVADIDSRSPLATVETCARRGTQVTRSGGEGDGTAVVSTSRGSSSPVQPFVPFVHFRCPRRSR